MNDDEEMSENEIRYWLKEFGEEVPENEPITMEIREEVKQSVASQNRHTIKIGKVNYSDKETFTKLKKGTLEVKAKLDLHGYSLDDARIAFYKFVKASAARGDRVILVVTGKGNFSGGVGVIKQNFPKWLNDEHLLPHILTCCYAPKHMGGDGAVLILLSRHK